MKKLILLAGAVVLLVAAPASAHGEDGHRRHQQGRLRAGSGDHPDRRHRHLDEQGHGEPSGRLRDVSVHVARADAERELPVHVHQGRQVQPGRPVEQEQEGDGHGEGGTGDADRCGRAAHVELRSRDDGLRHALDGSGEPEGRHPGAAVRRERREGGRHRDDGRPAARSRTTPSRRSTRSTRPGSGRVQRASRAPRSTCRPPDGEAEAERGAQVHARR